MQDSRAAALRTAVAMLWRAHRGMFAGRLLLTAVAGLAPVAAAWLLREILDVVSEAHRHASLQALVVALAAAVGLQTVLPYLGQYLSAQSGRATERLTSTELFAVVGRLAGLHKLEDPDYLDRLNVAQQAGKSGPGQIFTSGVGIVQSVLTLVGFLIALLALNPIMAAIVLAATIPGIYAELGIARRRAALVTRMSHAQRRQYFYANLLSSNSAAKEIRLFGLGSFFRLRMLDELRSIHRETQRVDRREVVAFTALSMLSALVAGAGLWWAISAAAQGRLTVGDVSIFAAALGAVSSSLSMIISYGAMLYQSLLMFTSYRVIVTEGPDLPMAADPAPAQPLRRGVELDNVWFRYGPDRPWILRGVSLFLPHGQAVAIVGRNGAGKSTLVKLICRFYDPDRGRILWDGVDLRDIDLAGLRDRMSVVFQDYMTYELSARDNIAIGDLSRAVDEESVTAAARQAGIHDTLIALHKGYDTLLTRAYFDQADKEDPRTGVMLSGGQWQRVALARAFLRGGRDLVILDEPSSGLDAEAEYEIHSGLRAHRHGRATMLISHRLNAVRDADRIVVLADGAVAEEGDHDSLMALSGPYARMFSLQARGFADDSREPAVGARSGPSRHG